jgi:hypothetical protein
MHGPCFDGSGGLGFGLVIWTVAMTLSPAAVTARRNVAQRIERLLRVVERAHRLPSRRERFSVRHALELMKVGQYPDAEEAML